MSLEITEKHIAIFYGKICPYCGYKPKLIKDSRIIYGKNNGPLWICKPCDAYVGTHQGGVKALGRLANKELRILKKQAHDSFDKIWQTQKMSRTKAYKWLSKQLGIPHKYTHIGMFGPGTCKKVIQLSDEFLSKNK